MSIAQKLKDSTIPSIYSAASSLALFYIFVDGNLTMNVPFANTSLPIYGAVGASSFIGSEIGHLTTDFALGKIPIIKDFEGIEKNVVPAALSGLATWAIMKTLISGETEFKSAFLVGAGGSIIGNNLYNM